MTRYIVSLCPRTGGQDILFQLDEKNRRIHKMKSVSKKIIALALAVIMTLSLSAVAFADSSVAFATSPLDDGYFSIIGVDVGVADDGILTVPAVSVQDGAEYPIASVDDFALSYNEVDDTVAFLADVTELVIEDGVKSIGEYAFMGMPALTKVTFKGDVELGNGAFKECALLEQVVFEGDAKIGDFAFAGCTALETIETAEGKSYDCTKSALEDTLWFTNYTVDYVTLGTTLVWYKGADEKVVLPLNITAIGTSAFEGNTTLKEVVFNKYIDTIDDRAFADCTALEKVVLSNDGEIKNIGSEVFAGTPFYEDFAGEFFIFEGTLVKYMGEDVEHVIIPKTVKAIAPDAFLGCYKYNEQDGYTFVISSIFVPASVTEFGEDCFVLAKFSEDEKYSPRIYAFAGTPAMEALTEAGYLVSAMENKKGDLDNDGKITAADARIALRLAVGLEEMTDSLAYAADIDGDNKVTAADARILLRIAVGLEDYTIDALMDIPTTKYEVLATYENALKQAAKKNVGYYKTVSNKIAASDICKIHSDKLLGVAQKNSVNQKYQYLANNQTAIDALPVITLQDTSLLKNAKCVAVDGKYHITLKFYDVQNCCLTADDSEYKGSAPYFASMIPTVTGDVFYNALAANKWWKFVGNDDNTTINCVRKYALRYTEPTINAIIDVATGMPEYIELKVGYDFALDGRINGIDVSSNGFKTGDATISRLDSVIYNNFG